MNPRSVVYTWRRSRSCGMCTARRRRRPCARACRADRVRSQGLRRSELSQELGNVTVRVKTLSKPLFDVFDRQSRRSRSVSISEQRRSLMLPQEIKELGRDYEILIYEGLRPVLAKKTRYFEDRRFRARLMPPPARAAPCSIRPVPLQTTSEDAMNPSELPSGQVNASGPPERPRAPPRPRRRSRISSGSIRSPWTTSQWIGVGWRSRTSRKGNG